MLALQMHRKGIECVHRVLKLLSEDPANYKDAPREGIRRVLEEVSGRPHPRDAPLDTSRIFSIRMGTTVSTVSSSSCFKAGNDRNFRCPNHNQRALTNAQDVCCCYIDLHCRGEVSVTTGAEG